MSQESFEQSLKRLEEIVNQLEKGDVSLSKSLDLFEEGMTKAKNCNAFLYEAKDRIQVLLKNEEGEPTLTPFDSTPLEDERL